MENWSSSLFPSSPISANCKSANLQRLEVLNISAGSSTGSHKCCIRPYGILTRKQSKHDRCYTLKLLSLYKWIIITSVISGCFARGSLDFYWLWEPRNLWVDNCLSNAILSWYKLVGFMNYVMKKWIEIEVSSTICMVKNEVWYFY